MSRSFAFFILVILYAFSVKSQALEDKFYFEDPKKSALFLDLTKELRCPKCQNQNIADSDAMIAVDLKRKVYELLQKGYNEQQVIDFMKQRYGDFVYYQPPVNPMTIWLWVLPVAFVLLAGFGIVVSRKKQVVEIDEEQLAKAKTLLERDE